MPSHVHHQATHGLHEAVVARAFIRATQVRGDDEVQVAVLGMAEDHRLGIAMGGETGVQGVHALGQLRDRKGDVLDDHRRARLAHRAHTGEQAFADVPVGRLKRGVTGEAGGRHQGHVGEQRIGQGYALIQKFALQLLKLDQQRRRLALRQAVRQFLAHPFECSGVQQLDRFRAGLRQGRHRPPSRFDIAEEQERRGPEARQGDGAEGRRIDERERAFAADHQALQDPSRAGGIEKGVQGIADRVLGRKSGADPGRQLGIKGDLLGQFHQPGGQGRTFPAQALVGIGDPSVDAIAVSQDQIEPGDRVVRVLMHATAHAAGVVGDDAADLGRLDRRRIRPDAATIRRQRGIDPGAHRARRTTHRRAAVEHLNVAETLGYHHQNAIGHRLAGQRGAAGAETHRHTLGVRDRQQPLDVSDVRRNDHDARYQTINRGVGSPLHTINEGVEHLGAMTGSTQAGGQGVGHSGLTTLSTTTDDNSVQSPCPRRSSKTHSRDQGKSAL